ncbi:hypothetical protein SAICODRAFT_24988, partial [Saitoella complicata NRRL Y-17804]|uniref:uncharacterized protein n=1 Tax=Saitoella complicata (strain BCRC 22490 / CBS 7301 / JCM 7358 / NBRC 10748 / NRRL Y-17804) TaxID=698492 RepID=UPI000866D1BE
DIEKIRVFFKTFVTEYEELYYQNNFDRLHVCPSSLHMVLHIADCIEYLGPCWVFWAFAMERVCGMVVPQAKSKSELNTSLANSVLLGEQLKHFQYVRQTSPMFCSFLWDPDVTRSFAMECENGWFVAPERILHLSPQAHRDLILYFHSTITGTARTLPASVDTVPRRVFGYKRFKLSNGRDMLGSAFSQRRSDQTPASNIILYIQETEGVYEVFFGEVLAFARPEFNAYGPAHRRRKKFYVADARPSGKLYEWVHVGAIERLVGNLSMKALSSEARLGRKPVWIIDRQTSAWNSTTNLIADM